VSAKRIPRNRKIFVNLRLGQHLGSNGSFLVRLSGAGVNVKRKLAPADLAKKADLNFIARKAGVIHLSAEIQTDLVGAYHETAPAAHLKSKVVNLVVR
jgi:hypothetical protein